MRVGSVDSFFPQDILSDWNSSLMSIVSGKTENHLDMLDNMVVERLLNDKWSSFARVRTTKHLSGEKTACEESLGEFRSPTDSPWYTFGLFNNGNLLTQS